MPRIASQHSASFEILAEGRARVAGAPRVRHRDGAVAADPTRSSKAAPSAIDLSGVTSSDSAGLALLIEWLSVAQAAGRSLKFENIPLQLHQLGA